MIAKLAGLGHVVVVGLNPLVPEWFGNDASRVAATVERIKASGASGVWLGWLHMNYKQVANLSERERQVIGEELISSSQGKCPSDETKSFIKLAVECCKANGLKFYVSGQFPEYGDLWECYRESYAKTFPCIADFVRQAKRLTPEQQHEQPIDFADFCDFALPHLPSGTFPECRDYVRTRQQVRNAGLGEARSYEDALRIIYQRTEFATTCPANHPSMGWMKTTIDGEHFVFHDEDGLPLLVCGKPESEDNLYIEGW